MPRPSNTRYLTTRYEETGTRFLVYPQLKTPNGVREPKIVYINAAPGTIRPGPQDDDIYVVDAPNKVPYFKSGEWPPYTGPRSAAAEPDASGHFDHIKPRDEAFPAATVFATTRCVLTIWERYAGRKLRWYFRDAYPRLEVIPRVALRRNAVSRYGYMEFGFTNLRRRTGPWCQNFDVVAHEVGHIILRDFIGVPEYRTVEYRAHEEACADLVAIVALLHFEAVVDRLLEQTKGNLYSVNVLSRMAELSDRQEIRMAFNGETMGTLPWHPDPDTYKYALALLFLGAAYDLLVEIFEHHLVSLDAIPADLAERSFNPLGSAPERGVQAEFAKHFKDKKPAFTEALLDARDDFGRLLARAWDKTSIRDLTHPRAMEHMLHADHELTGGTYRHLIRDAFAWRDIVPDTAG